jgi:hypothetical protein
MLEGMVDIETFSAMNAKRPFAPFWVRLSNGKIVHVTAPFTAIVTRKRFFYTLDRIIMNFVPMEEVEAYGPLPDAGGTQAEAGAA